MKKIITLILLIFMFSITSYAYEIENYIVTIEPRKDASIDVTYDITLKVTSEEQISDIKIPLLNESVSEIKSLSDEIESITTPLQKHTSSGREWNKRECNENNNL